MLNSASRFLLPAVRNAIQRRNSSVISGPPTNHVPKGELYVLGTTIIVSITLYPIWVLAHIKEYKEGGK